MAKQHGVLGIERPGECQFHELVVLVDGVRVEHPHPRLSPDTFTYGKIGTSWVPKATIRCLILWTLRGLDVVFAILTVWCLPMRKLSSSFRIDPRTPREQSVSSNKW